MSSSRFVSLDFVRGVAVLGILLMNAVAIGLGKNAYYNTSLGGLATPLDTVIGTIGEVVVDQKFMGLFSLLFGASIVLFHERAAAKGKRATALSLWRNALLLGIGFGHTLLWDGDVLMLYALCAPALLALRRLPASLLAGVGVLTYALSALVLWDAQREVGADALVGYWIADGPLRAAEFSESVEGVLFVDAVFRALGAMLVGMAAYKAGWLTQALTPARARVAWAGVALGLLGGGASVAWAASAGHSAEVAFVHNIPNTLGALPMAVGYALLLGAADARVPAWLAVRVRALGRSALTNYIAQTVLCLALLASIAAEHLTRTGVLGFVCVVWALQLWASHAWLQRYRLGPLEWAWRCMTYGRVERMRRGGGA